MASSVSILCWCGSITSPNLPPRALAGPGSLPCAPLASKPLRQVLVVVQNQGIQSQTALFLTLIKLGLFIK